MNDEAGFVIYCCSSTISKGREMIQRRRREDWKRSYDDGGSRVDLLRLSLLELGNDKNPSLLWPPIIKHRYWLEVEVFRELLIVGIKLL